MEKQQELHNLCGVTGKALGWGRWRSQGLTGPSWSSLYYPPLLQRWGLLWGGVFFPFLFLQLCSSQDNSHLASCARSSWQGLCLYLPCHLRLSMPSWVQGREFPFPSLNKWYFGLAPMQVCVCPRVTEARGSGYIQQGRKVIFLLSHTLISRVHCLWGEAVPGPALNPWCCLLKAQHCTLGLWA